MNFLCKKTNLLLTLALLTAPVLAACTADGSLATVGETGSIGLRLKVGDRNIDVVHYEITRPDGTTIVGDLNVASAKVLSFRIGGLPAGTGYTITLTAKTRDGEQTCSGSANFDVIANRVTSVAITLSCSDTDSTLGSIDVNGGFNQCPVVTSLVAAPLEVNVGETISLSATADDGDGDELVYAWSDEDASFSSEASAEYQCVSAGEHTLTLNVNDGNCVATETVTVNCSGEDTTGSDTATETDSTETTTTTTTSSSTETTTSSTETDSTETTTTTTSSSTETTTSSTETDSTETTTTTTTSSSTETSSETDSTETTTSSTTTSDTDSTETTTSSTDTSTETDSTTSDTDSTETTTTSTDTSTETDTTTDTGGDEDPRFVGRPAECEPCVQEFCTEEFWGVNVLDVCGEGDSDCTDILQCEWSDAENCVSGATLSVSCFCGPIDAADCATRPLSDPATTGQCKAEIIASLNANNNTEAFDRMLNTDYGAGRAHQLANCAASFCPDACGL